MAYAQLEPFDQTRADLRAGVVAATISNLFRGKHQPPVQPQDFFEQTEMTPEQTAAAVVSIGQFFGGKVTRGKS